VAPLQAGKTPASSNMSCGEVWTEYQELPVHFLGAIARQLVYTAGAPRGDGEIGVQAGGGGAGVDMELGGVEGVEADGEQQRRKGAGCGEGAVGSGARVCQADYGSGEEGGRGRKRVRVPLGQEVRSHAHTLVQFRTPNLGKAQLRHLTLKRGRGAAGGVPRDSGK